MGNDLSGSAQGAGGVGGLLEVTYSGAATTNCFVPFDGNGNVAALVNAADGTSVANYEYGPFGEVIRATGPMAKANPFRFSTKYQDDETDLLYYGYRYYKPSTGRWVSRDPIEEEGFNNSPAVGEMFDADEASLNVYAFVDNVPVMQEDINGLTGTLKIKLKKPYSLTCGGWLNIWHYSGSTQGPNDKFWMAQEIVISDVANGCATGVKLDGSDRWVEAIEVDGNFDLEDTDFLPSWASTYGSAPRVVAEASMIRYSSKRGKIILSWGHQVAEAGAMYSTRNIPSWWSKVGVMATRSSWKDSWNCCCSPHYDGTLYHYP